MPVARICKSQVWRNNEKAPCGSKVSQSGCPNRDYHILSMKTGYCSSGWCEGTKARDWRGRPVATCRFFMTCPCECHEMLWRMAAMTETERILHDNPEYVHPERAFWLPDDDPESWHSIPREEEKTPVYQESPVPDAVPPTLVKEFTPTTTGRAARGELESWVKEQCDIWLIEGYQRKCTPVWIAEQIGLDKGIKEPSVGAIGAVFDRWVKLGFAVIEKKPTRFIQYTPDGVRLGLDRMKDQAKRRNRLAQAERRRNLIR
jgi:hypothetical protein